MFWPKTLWWDTDLITLFSYLNHQKCRQYLKLSRALWGCSARVEGWRQQDLGDMRDRGGKGEVGQRHSMGQSRRLLGPGAERREGKKGRGNEKKGFVCRPTRQEIRKRRTIFYVTIASTIKRSARVQSLTKAGDFHSFCHLQGPYFKWGNWVWVKDIYLRCSVDRKSKSHPQGTSE